MVVPMEDFINQTDLHYFRAIKGGSVQLVLNVDASGKSNLKFRQLVDVYNQESTKINGLMRRIQPGEEVMSFDNVSELSEGSCMFGSEKYPGITLEPEDFNMTLETIRKTCKKRKHRNHRDTETASNVEFKHYNLTRECDLEDTNLCKRRKIYHKHKTKTDSTSSPSVIKFGVPEACEDSYSVSKPMDFISTDPEGPTVTEVVEEIMCHSFKDTRLALYCSPEPNSSGMVAVEELRTTKPVDKAFTDAPKAFNDAKWKTKTCVVENIALENQNNASRGSVTREETESVVPQSSESEIISQEVKEDEENKDSETNLSMDSPGLETMKKIETLEKLALDYIGLPTLGLEEEDTEIVWGSEDIATDDLPESNGNLHSVPDDIRISLEEVQLPERVQEQPASSGNVDEAEDQKAHDEVTTDADTNQPEKLLSGRKVLSPICQAKLLKAMEHPKKKKRSKGKLYFSSQNSHRILKAQGLESIDRVQVIQKANKRARHKFPRRDIQATKTEPFSSGCTSLKVCSAKAIAFSRGQIRDIQGLASKLAQDIYTMRDITKRCLLTDSNTSNTSAVETLIKNSKRNEIQCKKWLSTIERDSNRFCKLMGMVGEDTPDIENIDKKKIKFADDVGGDLCHVKFFEVDTDSE